MSAATKDPARPTVLVVDDEADILIALEDLLEGDYRVLCAGSGAEGLAILSGHGDVAVIVSDQRMPAMPGDAFLEQARRISDAGALLLTGYADLSAVVAAVNRGGIAGYVAKPWDGAALKSQVATVAERWRLGRELTEERTLMRGFLEATAERIAFKDRDGRFVRLNDAKAAEFGRSPAACIGFTETELGGDPAVEAADRAALASGRDVEEILESFDETGEHHDRVRRRPLAGPDGAPAYLMTTATDVTEQVLAERRLRQSDKMQALGTLAGGVAHDFNNLLTVILGSLELAARQVPPDNARLARNLRNAMEAADRGAKLTARLLSFSRPSEIACDRIDVNAMVQGMTDLLHHAMGTQLRLVTDLAPAIRPVSIDASQLEMAILNLVVNARDAMPGGGELRIETRSLRLAADEADLRAGDYAVIRVVDTGEGIPPALISRIFEPFFTTKEPGKGTGLGLSMAYTLMAAAGGAIRIQTEPGEGTTVELIIPECRAATPADEPLVRRGAREVRSARILVVDDDDAVRAVTASHLESHGHAVVQSSSGADALRLLGSCDVDLMIVDYAMPSMNGLELAAAARDARADLPILFVSGYTDWSSVLDRYDLVTKPYTADILLEAVDRALDPDAAAASAR